LWSAVQAPGRHRWWEIASCLGFSARSRPGGFTVAADVVACASVARAKCAVRWRLPGWTPVAIGALVFWGSRLGWAEEGVVVGLGYRAPAGCSERDELVRQLRARTARARVVAEGGEADWQFRVDIGASPGRAEAQLGIRDPEGRDSSRRLVGRDCDELVEALGLIVALTVDAEARTDPVSKLSAATDGPPSEETTSEPARDADGAAEAELPPTSHWAYGGGVQGIAVSGVAPGVLPGVAGFVDAAKAGDAWWLPAARLALRRAQAGGFQADGGTAAFRVTTAGLELCPTRLPPSTSVGLRPCVFGEVGMLRATGSNTIEPRSVSHRWIGLGPSARLELVPVSGLVFEARVAAEIPLVRARFLFAPEVFHEIDPVTLVVALGVAARFP